MTCVYKYGHVLSVILKRYYIFRDILARGILLSEEFAYIHLQQREMKCNVKVKDSLTQFQIVPNAFEPFDMKEITLDNIKRIKKINFNIYFHHLRLLYRWKIRPLIKAITGKSNK